MVNRLASRSPISPLHISDFLRSANNSAFYCRKSSSVKGQVSFFKHAGKIYCIGCYHVLCAQEVKHKIYSVDDKSAADSHITVMQKTQNGTEQAIGKVLCGKLNYANDFALAEVEIPDAEYVPFDCGNAKTHDVIFFMNAQRQLQQSVLLEKNATCTVRINGLVNIGFTGLLKARKFSRKGDSGALVWDAAGNVLGLVGADNASYTYIVPIQPHLLRSP